MLSGFLVGLRWEGALEWTGDNHMIIATGMIVGGSVVQNGISWGETKETRGNGKWVEVKSCC